MLPAPAENAVQNDDTNVVVVEAMCNFEAYTKGRWPEKTGVQKVYKKQKMHFLTSREGFLKNPQQVR